MKKVAIIQSCYIPWKGYFDIINSVDEFIIYDDVQYTKNDWRNRNIIKTTQGTQWLTIPVYGGINKLIKEVKVANNEWPNKHWRTLLHNYGKAPCFKSYEKIFKNLYDESIKVDYLSEVNYKFINAIIDILGIKTKITWSSDYQQNLQNVSKIERLVNLCQVVGATCYVSGPLARNYIDEELFKKADIELKYVDYSGYPTYHQLHGEFSHNVSILDLIFNEGVNAPSFMKSFT